MDSGIPQLPEWLIKLFFCFAALGVAASGVGAVALVWWVVSHLHWS